MLELFLQTQPVLGKSGVENYNGLVRRNSPKGYDLATITLERLLEVEEEINNRPRDVRAYEGFRVTEVAQGDEFDHQIDKDGTNLEIAIKQASGSRKVYYHLRHGIT